MSSYVVAGDLNGHVGAAKDGYSCHGGFGYGSRNVDGERILEYAESHSLTIIGFVLVKDRDRSIVTDAKVVPNEMVERCGTARIKLWRMREKEAAVISGVRLLTVTTVDETWKKATDAIRQAARLEIGTTKPGRRKVDKQTWLWTDVVKAKVREKKSLYHVFLGEKTADNWRKYQEARKAVKKAVAVAKAGLSQGPVACIRVFVLSLARRASSFQWHYVEERTSPPKRWRDYFEESRCLKVEALVSC
ncbi:unnamed protein product [Heligmosomoides polygyrus]|uniref:Endo/exonuclease/phosphatase domain-containing protein n=1 Tax=Heligmosomoides polygyrus TaxID=6339 RepID=A0A3P8BLN8_HELPZ|nr:unnamed protein product [Heligmosomoides polygyrus]